MNITRARFAQSINIVYILVLYTLLFHAYSCAPPDLVFSIAYKVKLIATSSKGFEASNAC